MSRLIARTHDPVLEARLRASLAPESGPSGAFGPLEPLAIRLGLILGSAEPRLRKPQLQLFAGDHGLVVDGIAPAEEPTTATQVQGLLGGRSPLPGVARIFGLAMTVVDAGVADRLPPLTGLVTRKIAHGTRNARAGAAMTPVQTQAAIRAGMEIADAAPGNVIACAGLGVGGDVAASLVVSRLSDVPARVFLDRGDEMPAEHLAHLEMVCQGAQGRHRDVHDPIDTLAAFGGFETAMMTGLVLAAARRRCAVLLDGFAACAALHVARRVDPAVTDYVVLARSRSHAGLAKAHALLDVPCLPDSGLETLDGTAAVLGWPLLHAASLLLPGGAPPGGRAEAASGGPSRSFDAPGGATVRWR